jgi:archaellum biogenesis ATPase FlaH
MDVVKELDENQTVLAIMPSIAYNSVSLDITKKLSKKNVCYVTLNKTFPSISDALKKKGVNVNNMVFIDAISKSIRSVPDQDKNCYFVSSPAALTELSLAITKFLEHDFDYIIFDSLTNLLVYESKAPVAKFLSSLINKIKNTKTKAIFYVLDIKDHSNLIQQAEMFVDNVLDFTK